MDQQFSLSWNNFHGNLSKGFSGLLGNSEFVDVTIAVDGHILQAHKVILSICSPYFKKMFQINPCQHPIIVLRDVTLKAMRDLLQFMYHGEVSVKREDLTSFIGTAEMLQIKGLTNKEIDTDDENTSHREINNEKDSQITETNCDTREDKSVEPTTNEIHQEGVNLTIQKKLIESLTNLKRKSEEIIKKNYFSTDIYDHDKRPRLKDKLVDSFSYNAHNNIDYLSTLNKNLLDGMNNSNNDVQHSKDKNNESDISTADVKSEIDERDIGSEAMCSSPKDLSRDTFNDVDYAATQESALSLVKENELELPCRYKYIYSRKGHKQLVHMNFVYTKHSTSHGKTSWRCVQYFSLNRCPATVETFESFICAINHKHNHEDYFDKICQNQIYEMECDKR